MNKATKDTLVKPTVAIPVALPAAAKIAAVKEGTDLRTLVIEGLKARLKGGPR